MASLESRVNRIEEVQEHQQDTLGRIEEKVDRNAEKADRKVDRNAEKIDQNGRRLDRAEGGSSQMSERITSLDNRVNTLTLVVFGTGATLVGLMVTVLIRMG